MRRAPGKPAQPFEPRAGSRRRGYTTEWERAAAEFRQRFPFCLGCAAVGKRERAIVVDHIEPHRGNQALFSPRPSP